MKKLLLVIVSVLVFNFILPAQSPDAFNYQAVLRNSDGEVMSNENVELEISILYGTATGIAIYTETFNEVTNQIGLVNLKIGSGTSSDDFTSIDWSEGMFFLQITVNGTALGANQLLSVPYAKFADEAGNAFSGNYNDLTNLPNFSGWDMSANDDFSGDYNDLDNLPDFNLWDKNALDDFSGNYTDLVNTPTFAGWDKDVTDDFSGNYNDLSNRPTFTGWDQNASDDFSGDYNDLTNLPDLIDTSNFISIVNPTIGDLAYYDGSKWQSLNTGAESQVLGIESGIPKWKSVIGIDTVKRIGELYLGGIIFYVSPDGQHGLIADLDDTSVGDIYSSGNTTTGATSFHDGVSNTDSILLIFPASNAASTCRLKGPEWYLPSVWEMKLLHIAAYEINRILENDSDGSTNGLNTSNGTYWTSTEYSANQAYDYSVITGVVIDDNRSSTYRVRAIRAF
ncbi:hypothetical protein ACFLSE_00405 [Bacteroidota bacterium]